VPDINVAQLFIAFSVLLFSLTIHEMAHAWTADRLGDPTARQLGRVSVNPLVHVDPIGTVVFPLLAMVGGFPLIGWAKPVPVVVSRLRNERQGFVLVAAAGPASNVLLAFAAAAVLALLPIDPVVIGEPNVSAPLATLLNRAVQINLLLAVFNMIPVPPLDGGNVLAGILPRGLASVFDRLRPYGIFVLYALLLTGGFSAIVGPPYNFLRSLLP
jgi:Zn-dependent protease